MPKYINVDKLKFPNVAIYDMMWEGKVVPVVRLDELRKFPSEDVVEVVRCRDCVYWRGKNDCCEGIGIDFSENGYCSFGKRKDGGQNDD